MDAERIAMLMLSALINYALISSLLMGTAWVAEKLLAERSVRLAEQLWKGALVSSVVAPLLQLAIPANVVETSSGSLATSISTRVLAPSYSIDARLSLLIVAAWLAIAMFGVVRLVRAHLAMCSTLKTRRPLGSVQHARLVQDEPDLREPISVCSAIDIPLVLGREICLPTWALDELPVNELNAVIAHEAAHLRRGDTYWRWASSLIARVLFFQPLNFIALARLRELAECVCDDEAISGRRSAIDLAGALETFASLIVTTRPHLLPSLATRESLTLRRVRRILTGAGRSSGRSVPRLTLATIMFALSALSLYAPRFSPALPPTIPYVVTARDGAGLFTLTLHRGRVIAATVNGETVPPDRLRQTGRRLDLLVGNSPFTVELTPAGGIAWRARSASRPNF